VIDSGAELAQLLLGGFRVLVEQAQDELARRGHPGVRPVHEFALRAVAGGADTTSELARGLGVSKQAAGKTVSALLEWGYLEQRDDERDARRKRLTVTARGRELLSLGQAIFDTLREQWAGRIGPEELDALQAHLRALVESTPARFDTAGWMSAP
jgi:DNA-binding MarR family transcriptional regulator